MALFQSQSALTSPRANYYYLWLCSQSKEYLCGYVITYNCNIVVENSQSPYWSLIGWNKCLYLCTANSTNQRVYYWLGYKKVFVHNQGGSLMIVLAWESLRMPAWGCVHTRVLSSCASWLRSMVAAGTPGVAAPSPGGVLVGGLKTHNIDLMSK